MSFQTP
ncbi:hypothetical protein AZE42_13735, partial [Rhizopogon vesiculosus]